jgi:hypothetical protein
MNDIEWIIKIEGKMVEKLLTLDTQLLDITLNSLLKNVKANLIKKIKEQENGQTITKPD